MLFRYILKNMKRSAVTNGLFCLLLVFSGALFSLAAGLWYSVYSTEKNLDEIITTIAVVDNLAMRRYVRRELSDNDWSEYELELYERFLEEPPPPVLGILSWVDPFLTYATPRMQAHYLNIISDFHNSGLVGLDSRRVFGGYVSGLASTPIHLTEQASLHEFLVHNSPQSSAAFIVYCEGVEEVYEYSVGSLNRSVIARFIVEEDIHLHAGARRTRTVTGYFPYANPDGSLPVEAGKRYIIVGDGYAQGQMRPYWYYSLPSNMFMPNALRIMPIGSNSEQIAVGEIEVMALLDSNIIRELIAQRIGAEQFPLALTVRVPLMDQMIGYEGYTWFEIEGSLEDALASASGENIKTALSKAEIATNSLLVITSSDMNSLVRFNQRASVFTKGRAINSSEHRNGARVCVISEYLAEENGLSVGDTLPLQLYPASLKSVQTGNDIVWPLDSYCPGFPITEPIEYTIVGIFTGPRWELSENAIHANTIIIPDASFEGFDTALYGGIWGTDFNDPPLLKTIVIPNGKIPEVKAIVESELGELAAFFKYYDQGYTTLMPVLSNLNTGLIWVLLLSAVGWVIAVVMFSLFYVARKRRDAMILSGIGVGKGTCMRWIFIQSAIVIIIAQLLVLGATLPVYENILNSSVSVAREFTQSYRNYTLSEMQEAGGVELFLPLDNTNLGLVFTAMVQTLSLLTATVFLSINAAKHRPLGRRDAI